MKIIKSFYKCSVCGIENEYFDYMSNSIYGYSDFDRSIGNYIFSYIFNSICNSK